MFSQETLPFIETPLFFLQPKYDFWVTQELLCTVDWHADVINSDGALATQDFLQALKANPYGQVQCSGRRGVFGR